jgi:hypothetical protein
MSQARDQEELNSWLAWIGDAEEIVRDWEAERRSMLPTSEALLLTQRIARAIEAAVKRGRPRRI